MVGLVAGAEPPQDGDGLLDRRLDDPHRLEAPLQRRVLLDVPAVLLGGRRADELQLAAGQRGLEDGPGVHGAALGGTGADHCVQLVDEDHDRPLGRHHLVDHGGEALLEVAAVPGAGDHPGQVQRHHPDVAQPVGDVAVDDPLGDALDDRGLADAGVADEHGVVLGAAGEHLEHLVDLVVAPHDRVEATRVGRSGEVAAVAVQVPGGGARPAGLARGRRGSVRSLSNPCSSPAKSLPTSSSMGPNALPNGWSGMGSLLCSGADGQVDRIAYPDSACPRAGAPCRPAIWASQAIWNDHPKSRGTTVGLTRTDGPLSPRVPDTVNYRLDGPAHKLLMHPFPRRVRAEFAGRTVLDTRDGVLLHETAPPPPVRAGGRPGRVGVRAVRPHHALPVQGRRGLPLVAGRRPRRRERPVALPGAGHGGGLARRLRLAVLGGRRRLVRRGRAGVRAPHRPLHPGGHPPDQPARAGAGRGRPRRGGPQPAGAHRDRAPCAVVPRPGGPRRALEPTTTRTRARTRARRRTGPCRSRAARSPTPRGATRRRSRSPRASRAGCAFATTN